MKRIDQIIKKTLHEATGDSSGGRGSYAPPMQPGLRYWSDSSLGPFSDAVSDFKSPLVQYDSYDKKFDLRRDQIKKLEKTASKIQDYIKHHPYSTFSDDDGNPVNPYMQDGFNPNVREKLSPFTETVPFNEWVEVANKGTINEDLAVWFGKKKKPKGSSQPKGPWVNICRKVDGKNPPCGRHDTSKGSYPKCRAAGVAGKMSDSAKRAACAQKRAAEKKDPQTGKGQKPVMTSYKPKNESIMKKTIRLTENQLIKIVKNIINEQQIKADYKMVRDDAWNESTFTQALYFVKNGDTFDVWYETPTQDIVSSGLKLPKKSELGIVYNSDAKEFTPNDAVMLGRRFARSITTSQGMGNSVAEKLPSLIVYTDEFDGLPKKGVFKAGSSPLGTFKGQSIPLEDGSVAAGEDYFITTKPSRKDRYGQGSYPMISSVNSIAKKV